MAKVDARLETARGEYRAALQAARSSPTPEAWSRLLAAGRELSLAEQPPPRSRRGRKSAAPPEGLVDVNEVE